MAKANVILLNSILWNLRELTKLAEKIKKHCGDVDCLSWRYPLTSCSELEIFKLLQNNRNLDNYTYILELTYDRLLYLFNLMIKYLESTDSLENFRPSKNVYRPKTLSLASVLHMIWDRIQAQTESLNRTVRAEKFEEDESEKILYEKSLSKCSICTQSEVCSISLCSCCEMVQKFITQLVLELERILEKHDYSSAISIERKNMREYLVEMTSWSAMSRWLTALVKDFTTISEVLEQVTTNSRKLRHRIDSGDRKMKHKSELYEEDMKKHEARLRDYDSKMADLKQKIEKLVQENNQLKEEIQSKNLELVSINLNFENKIAELKKNYENQLEERNDNKTKTDQKEAELKETLDAESKKLEKMESQNKKLEETILKLKEDLESLNMKTTKDKDSLLIRLKELEHKIEILKQENISLNSVIEEKQKTIKDYSKRIMEAFPELNVAPKARYKASGNPETDMKNQIEANKLRIEEIKLENEKLQKTVDKLRAMKG